MNSRIEKNRTTIHNGFNFIIIIIFVMNLLSCVSQKQVEYLQGKNVGTFEYPEAEFPDYELKPNDELYIQINSLDEATANAFSSSIQQSANIASIDPWGASLLSYSVDLNGFLILPLLGKIYVKDKTISTVSQILQDSLSHILNQPIVTLKLVNRYVSILGEVTRPGNYPYGQDKLSIFDAISLAGDLSEYANRHDVILVRNEDGKNIKINLDLTKSSILSSPYYNLRPNDIIYIKPLQKKFWGMRQFPFSVLFSTLTTGLLIYNIFK